MQINSDLEIDSDNESDPEVDPKYEFKFDIPLSPLWWEKPFKEMNAEERFAFEDMMTDHGTSEKFYMVEDGHFYENGDGDTVYWDYELREEFPLWSWSCRYAWICEEVGGPKWYQSIDPSYDFVTFIDVLDAPGRTPGRCLMWKNELKAIHRWKRLAFFFKVVGPALRESLEMSSIKPGGQAYESAKNSFYAGVTQMASA